MQLSRFHSVDFKVGIIGALNLKYKGQTVLLKAISTLDDAIKRHITLYFVGSGNYDRIIKKAEKLRLVENIKFIGPLPHEEIFNLLSTLSLYVHPSFKEGLPRALLEAMSMGCPVLGSTNGGIPEVVKSEYLHKPGDYKTLSRQIQNFYEDRALLEREAFTSLELVEPYLKENLDKKRNDFYKILVNKIIK
jgi:glycosyltransferase involved in cell wall biosynthesis